MLPHSFLDVRGSNDLKSGAASLHGKAWFGEEARRYEMRMLCNSSALLARLIQSFRDEDLMKQRPLLDNLTGLLEYDAPLV